jgi:Family of unknown function (DUF5947)
VSSRLLRLARSPESAAPPEAPDTCDLCAEPLPERHRHLLDLESRKLLCACRACVVLFDREAAGGGHFRLLPEERRLLEGFELDDALWNELLIPVDMAFFFRESTADRVVALYPSPMGATESLLELGAWDAIEAANPVLREMRPDVEALLVNRARGAREHWLVPLDVCFDLVGLMRRRWKGLGGGEEVWEALDGFFGELRRQATVVPRAGNEREVTAR